MNCISYFFPTRIDYKQEYHELYFLLYFTRGLIMNRNIMNCISYFFTRGLIINRNIINCISYYFYTRFDYKQEYHELYFLLFLNEVSL